MKRGYNGLMPRSFLALFVLTTLSLSSFTGAIASESKNSARISSREFLSGDFPQALRARDYPRALKALDALAKQYPDDPLILRYRARMLEKLGRRKEAIAAYRKILAADPKNIPARLFLGLAYAREGNREKAVNELRRVAQNSGAVEYQHWAQAQLARLRAGKRKFGKRVEKKPYLLGKAGVAYDSNPRLVPDDESLSSRSKEDGVLYKLNLDLGYPLLLKKDRRLDALYLSRVILHDEGSDQVNFATQGVALDAKRRTFFWNRAVVLGGRYDARVNFLRSDLFSVVNRLLLSADTSFCKRTRTGLYGRVSYSNYNQDGSRPKITSRDGVRGGLGVVQYFYTADLRSYVFIKQEVSGAATRGDNYDRVGYLARIGAHTPLDRANRWDADASVGFDRGSYPEFSSLSSLEPGGRLDSRLDFYGALTHHWKPNLATRAFYRFIDSDNRNDFFDRRRQIAGVEMVFSL